MKKFLFPCLLFLSTIQFATAQSFEWITHSRIKYTMNPSYPEHLVKIDSQDRFISSHIDSNVIVYGQNLYGVYLLECRDVATNLIWTFTLNNKACITKIACDKLGNTYVAGSFMETMHLNNSDSLANTSQGLNRNAFVLKLDNDGQLIWKKNLSLGSAIENVDAIACNNQNEICYAFSDFFTGTIQFMDAQGNSQAQYLISNGKIISDLEFDTFNNLFVVGAAQSGSFSIGTLNYTIPHDYAMFVARYSSNGQASWAHFAHDITFQNPDVAVDASGNAFVGGLIMMDSTDFGAVSFHAPQWSSDFFIVKVDSTGNFLWGQQSPLSPTITGKLVRGNGHFLKSDGNGGVYAGLDLLGSLSFSNGLTVTAGSGAPTDRSNCIMQFDANGNPLWSKLGGSPNSGTFHSLDLDSQGKLYFTAHLNGNAVYDTIQFSTNGSQHFVLGRLGTNPLYVESSSIEDQTTSLFPNPACNELFLSTNETYQSYSIFDLRAALLQAGNIQTKQAISIASLNPGCYFIKLENQEKTSWIKFIKNN